MSHPRERIQTEPLTVRVRAFGEEDYSDLVRISAASYPDDPSNEEEMRHNDAAWDHKRYWFVRFVAETDGATVGMGRMNHMPWEFDPNRYVMSLMVDPARRRRGVGTAMFAHVLETVTARGAVSLPVGCRRNQ